MPRIPIHIRLALAAAALCALGGTASAQELSLDVSGAFTTVQSDRYYAISEDNQASAANVGLGLEFWDHLWVQAGYSGSVEQTTLFQTIDTDFRQRSAVLGLRYRYPLTTWLYPYALASMSFNWGDLDLGGAGRGYNDTAFAVGAHLAGGFEAIWYFGGAEVEDGMTFWERLGIGITNDYGYAFGPTYEVSEVVPEDRPGAHAANLGEIDMSGFVWRIGATLRYRF